MKKRVLSKKLKFVMLKCRNHSITTENYAVTSNQTLRGGSLTPRADKTQKMTQILKKLEKNCEN